LWGEQKKNTLCHASSVSINRNFNKQGVTNRAINKMMQQLFIETQALFIETLPDYLLQELKQYQKVRLYSISISQKCRCFGERFRLKFEELFFIQLQLIMKNKIQNYKIKRASFYHCE
jgi:ATP-dependent DNA helicase RecG